MLSPSEMALADAAVFASGDSVEALVERAGRAVAWSARRLLGGTYGRRVVALCGKGNNGADGRQATLVLRAWGARAEAHALAPGFDRPALTRALLRCDLVIDAMFGTGLRGALAGDAAWAAAALGEAASAVLSVDIPSGVDAATGAVPGPAVRAGSTVCLAALKPGVVLEPGASLAGVVEVADIGIPFDDPALGVTERADVASWLPWRRDDTHKWEVGAVFVVAGSPGLVGAADLASISALRAGAGAVVCGLPGGQLPVALRSPEVMTRLLPATPSGGLDERAADDVLEALGRFAALVIGPGLGRRASTAAAVRSLVARAPLPLVLDADGLSVLDGDLGPLRSRPPGSTVVTPHRGEYARLAGEEVGPDPVGAARRLARRCGAVVLLKGSRTVVASPSGRAALNPTGGSALASAGTGDVLSGIIAAFLARGVAPFEAAAAAAFVHGAAAAAASGRHAFSRHALSHRAFGHSAFRYSAAAGAREETHGLDRLGGLVASDVLEAIPVVLSTLSSLTLGAPL